MSRWLIPFALSLVCGCSSDETSAAPCNTLRNDGPKLTPTVSDESAPEPMGGEIAEGTYALVGITYYGAASSLPTIEIQTVFEIDGDTVQQVGSIDDEETRYTSTFTASGTTFTTRDSCPAPLTSRFEFTATADDFYIYDTRADGVMEQHFNRRD